ncbi:hypothetical protein BX600DRAFT_450855 [Xylariales sp. PMI_506]|nr:hypothetical protein BX600DRAFT_450855 [Xylariales sp. PMI_506]
MSDPAKSSGSTSGSQEQLSKDDSYERVVETNAMNYYDDKGVRHFIYTPKGTAARARELLMAKNWDELAKFAPYTGQGYTEDDYIYVKKPNESAGGTSR